MDTKDEAQFLGRGWSFPPKFSLATRGVEIISGTEDIHQSLQILLSTSLGERVMRPDYGCNLDSLMFEPITTTLKTYITGLIETAVLLHEPRIKLLKVEIQEQEELQGAVTIHLDYVVKSTNSRRNLVYPFYIKEATAFIDT